MNVSATLQIPMLVEQIPSLNEDMQTFWFKEMKGCVYDAFFSLLFASLINFPIYSDVTMSSLDHILQGFRFGKDWLCFSCYLSFADDLDKVCCHNCLLNKWCFRFIDVTTSGCRMK